MLLCFWEVEPDPETNLQSKNMDPAPHSGKGPPAEDIVPEKVMLTMSVPASIPEDSKCKIACATLSDAIQDTKPVEQLRTVCNPDITETTAENNFTPSPMYLQATIWHPDQVGERA